MGLSRYLIRKKKFIIITVLIVYSVFLFQNMDIANGILKSESIYNVPKKSAENLDNTTFERIDWNNYSFMEREARRTGLGEHGIAVKINLTEEEKLQQKELMAKYNYDAYLAGRISLERSIGDIRPNACLPLQYLKNIPENSVSVILPMYKEKNFTLLRTIYSIINRSPASLLREIIVVDDFSQEEELNAPLDDYIRQHFSKVKIIRNKQREGLTRSRTFGADASSGTFLVFLDSHVEVNHNFLPPLLEIIMLDYRTVPCPMVDTIEELDYKVVVLPERSRGAFNWNLDYRRMPVTFPIDEVSPHDNPIMIGGAFAISRKWWEEIGKYDPGLKIWGAEQYELSLKIWLCGGRIVDLPCSRVAHLYRDWPYLKDLMAVIDWNFMRFATVWLDGYREVVLKTRPFMRKVNPGDDIVQQVELRRRLKCKSFDWFLTEVAPDMLKYFPLEEASNSAWGQLRSKENSSLCVYTRDKFYYLGNCNKQQKTSFTFDWRHHIFVSKHNCFMFIKPDYLLDTEYIDIEITEAQSFAWNIKTGQIANYKSHLCLDVIPESLQLRMKKCDESKSSQKWTFEFYNTTAVVEVWEKYTKTIHSDHT